MESGESVGNDHTWSHASICKAQVTTQVTCACSEPPGAGENVSGLVVLVRREDFTGLGVDLDVAAANVDVEDQRTVVVLQIDFADLA